MNKRNRIIFTLALIATLSFTLGPDSGWKRLFSIPVQADFFTTDHLGNIYAIHQDQIVKYNAKGELLKKYSNKRLGRIYSVDVSNPLRILVFYREFSAIVILDSQLTENAEGISLEQYDLEQCDLACTSFNNGIWLFNRQNMELVRLNESLEKVVNTGNLNRLLGMALHPNFIMEYNGFVYLNDPSVGILLFDIYGTFSKTIHLKNLNEFQVREQQIFYLTKPNISAYQMRELTEQKVSLPDTFVVGVREQNSNFYFLYKDSVAVYSRYRSK